MSINSALLLLTFYYVAIVADAMTAALAAGRRSMDWMGVAMLGPITALGGGTVRDVLFQHYPLTWVHNPALLLITAGASLATIAIARYMHHLRRLFLLLDAIGLVAFSVIGCNIAAEMKLPFLIIIASGMITGCVGGVLRDILCDDIPLLFRTELYATVSIFTGLVYMGGQRLGAPHDLAALAAMAAGLTLRLLALRFGWSMPKFVYTDTLH
ncbi:trimeric intracellular cation channel family protein [Camelimonas abortus]|uniref:Trimeric intracellular cation channel family protein n=1 Tax=Camelimonas abortus TaxID=1017184 RepID=A0ABV7LG14_9HYPH